MELHEHRKPLLSYQAEGEEGRVGRNYSPQSPYFTIHVMMMMMLVELSRVQFGLIFKRNV